MGKLNKNKSFMDDKFNRLEAHVMKLFDTLQQRNFRMETIESRQSEYEKTLEFYGDEIAYLKQQPSDVKRKVKHHRIKI